ncbi:acyl-CoA thioester hydrolase [Aliiruegeria haliotis]|uniref:Acyl-CoA thioester hydrolase n=1 Tax=Aliiruegeria haliotis TaxID=1280846 RepID=A0A2T0RWC5_9RHOB|nr:thioesterase family protein [Aliiruegeria haliotis]PRY25489.1 acyl-CoA thioester hydrolase [Aliiruegeria haliotis]
MTMIDRSAPHEIDIEIRASDIDMMGHVNNTVYLRWVQDAATAHWDVIATDEDQANLLWIVARHEIDYKRPAYAGDDAVARTWLGAATGAFYERHTEILRRRDGQLLARALTLWCPLDAATRKPVRLTPAQRKRYTGQG